MLARKCIGFGLTQVQLFDVSCGLSFLHSRKIVHGDLKGVRHSSFLRYASVGGNLVIFRYRIMFSLTSQVMRGSTTSGSLESLALAV